MKPKQIIVGLLLLVISGVATQVKGQMKEMPSDHIMAFPNDIKWGDAPPALPPGAKAAVIEGDPGVVGLFTMRIKVPAGYKIMPHWHPADDPGTKKQ